MPSRRSAIIFAAAFSVGVAIIGALNEVTLQQSAAAERNARWMDDSWLRQRLEVHLAVYPDSSSSSCTALVERLGLWQPRLSPPDDSQARPAPTSLSDLMRRNEQAKPAQWLRAVTSADSIALVAAQPCGFARTPFPPSSLDWEKVRRVAAEVGALAIMMLLPFAWVLTYSHTGWRRLALVCGALAAPVLWIVILQHVIQGYGVWLGIAASAALASTLVLVARDTVLWVRRGFAT